MKRMILLLGLFLLAGPVLGTGERWSVHFSVCDQGYFLFVVDYADGDGPRSFDWDSGDDSGSVKLWPDRAPSRGSIYTADNEIAVHLDGQTKYAQTDIDCMDSGAALPRTFVYLVAVLDVPGPVTWACGGHAVIDPQGDPITTPVQFMPWDPAGGALLPYSVLILSHYIEPGECVAYADGVAVGGAYVDFERFACLAFQHKDRDCPGTLAVRG